MRVKLKGGDCIPLSNITLGGDPEFEVYDLLEKEVIPAGELSSVGGFSSPIGLDGSGAQVELRPLPARSPGFLIYRVELKATSKPHLVIYTPFSS